MNLCMYDMYSTYDMYIQYGYIINAYQMKVVIIPAVCMYISRCSLHSRFPIPTFKISQHLSRSTPRTALLLVNSFDPALFVGVFPLPLNQLHSKNCLSGPDTEENWSRLDSTPTLPTQCEILPFLNLPTLLWQVSVHTGIDLLLPSHSWLLILSERIEVA